MIIVNNGQVTKISAECGTKIAEYKQISTQTEEYTVVIPDEYDDEGNVISEEKTETRTREVPVMGLVYRDMTVEEEAELAKNTPADVPQEKSVEEQISELREALDALLRGDTE